MTSDNTHTSAEIMVVEDSTANLTFLADILTRAGFQVRPATDGELALRSLKARLPDLVLMDIRLPGKDGIAVCRQMKSDPETAQIPVVFISALNDTREKVRALESGGVDYVTKPISPSEVLTRIRIHIRMYRLQRALTETTRELRNENRVRRKAEARLRHQHHHLEQLVEERTAALRKSERKFRTVADFTHDWEYWIGPDNTLLYVSPSCERITGYGPDAFMARPGLLDEIIHPEDRPEVIAHRCRREHTRDSLTMKYRIRTREGEERWISHVCQTVYDDAGAYLGKRGSDRDITDQKQLQEQAVKARRMEAIATLAGGIAHQFNNALTILGGNLEMLTEDLPDHSPVIRYAGAMAESAERMRQLTTQLLTYARGGKFQAAPISLNSLVAAALPIIRPENGSRITVTPDIQGPDLMVTADRAQMEMVLSAVLTNAYESMDSNGAVRVSLRKIDGKPLDDTPDSTPAPGPYACLTVSDNGRGMSEATVNRIFEPFFSTKFQGRGLGMASVYGIVDGHQGAVTVSSREGEGTEVSIFLPLIPPGADKHPAHPPPH